MGKQFENQIALVQEAADVRVREKESELTDARGKLALAETREADLLRRQREFAEREQGLELDMERRIGERLDPAYLSIALYVTGCGRVRRGHYAIRQLGMARMTAPAENVTHSVVGGFQRPLSPNITWSNYQPWFSSTARWSAP